MPPAVGEPPPATDLATGLPPPPDAPITAVFPPGAVDAILRRAVAADGDRSQPRILSLSELERSGDPCDHMALLQRCGEDDAAAELWDLKTPSQNS